MRAAIIVTIMGVIGLKEDGEIVEFVLFSRDISEIAKKLFDIEIGSIVTEVTSLLENLKKKGYTSFVFENSKLAKTILKRYNVDVNVEIPSKAGEVLRRNLGIYAVKTGFLMESSEINEWIHNISMEKSKLEVKKKHERKDILIVQAIQALDDIDKSLNLLMNRIREWYGIHFPELSRMVNKNQLYAKLILNIGNKNDFTTKNLEEQGLFKRQYSKILIAARKSMGATLSDIDLTQLQELSNHFLLLSKTRSDLEKYLSVLMEEVASNTMALVGATLGGRVIALAGGLENLAKMPASTIQVLGAEKALFRSLTTGAKPPKHGVIFQHALIHTSKKWVRGKIARAFAGKLAIAARIDAFGKNSYGNNLRKELQTRIEEIEKKYPEPKYHRKSDKNTIRSKYRKKRHGTKN